MRQSRGFVTEESFRRVFHDSPVGMVLADLDLQVLDANAAFAAFLGREIDDLVGCSVASYTEPGDMELTLRQHAELLAGATGHYTIEKRYVRADGSLVWGEITVSLLRDDRDRPVAVHAQVQDISGRKQVVEALDRRARYSEAAAELGRIALVAADVHELAERLAEVVAERLEADACLINRVDGMELHSLAVVGEPPGRGHGERWTMRARSLAGLVFSTDGPLVVEDLASSDVDASAQLLGSGMRSAMGVSVEGRDGPAGMVAAFTRQPRAWTSEETSFLHVVANVMGSAIERAAREEAAIHRSLHDPLTGLPNRQLFADRLALTLARARRGGAPPAVLIADLDQFKLINDSLGHQAGDELLQAVAPRLAAAVRDDRHGRALRGRRVRGAVRLGRQRAAGARRSPSGSRPSSTSRSSCRAGRCTCRRRSGSRTRATAASPRTCCATPTPRSTARRRAAAGAASCSTRRCGRRRSRGSRSRPGCGSRSAPISSRSTSSRWSTSRAVRRWRSRGWRAGAIRCAGRCRPASSSPWPRTAG